MTVLFQGLWLFRCHDPRSRENVLSALIVLATIHKDCSALVKTNRIQEHAEFGLSNWALFILAEI
jgi:hypothetical protein